MPYYPNYQNNYNYQIPQQQNVQQGFVLVKNEAEAMSYPVALGNSVVFKNESQPYIYVKTLGFSQLDQPMFEKFKLVKEEPQEEVVVEVNYREEIDLLKKEIMDIKHKLEEKENE